MSGSRLAAGCERGQAPECIGRGDRQIGVQLRLIEPNPYRDCGPLRLPANFGVR